MPKTAKDLSEEEILEFREIFNLVDTDGSGDISKAELGLLCTKLGLSFTSGQLDQMIMEIDKNNDGEIDFDEFIAVLSNQAKPAVGISDLKRAFHVFSDPSDRSFVLVHEVERALLETTKGSATRTRARVKQLINVLDPDGTGRVAYEDFVDVMSF